MAISRQDETEEAKGGIDVSISAKLDTGQMEQIATNKGWGEFSRWVRTLEMDQFPVLHHLVEYGWTQKVPEAREQLLTALGGKQSKNVADIGAGLVTLIREAKLDDVLVITNGLGPDDGQDDD